MMKEAKKNIVDVRGLKLSLSAFNRSLDLCSRMNYETENLDFIDSIPKGHAYFDLGACEGRFSIYAAKRGLKVFSFEPEKDNFEVLRENIEDNELSDKITPFNFAIGDADKVVKLQIGQPWAGGHQKVVQHEMIREDFHFDVVAEQPIQMVSLDSCIEKNNLPVPNYLKVDIDGSETLFLSGAEKTLQNPALSAIIFELCTTDKSFQNIIRQLEIFGFIVKDKFQVPNEPNLFNFIFERG